MDKLDILNRDEFVDRLIKLIENISANKTSTCFALSGAWGCGKSFVLDMLEEKLKPIQSQDTYNDKYFVIRYNCWKYDYYEEPLIAIVATMISAIEEETKLFPNSKEKREIVGVLKAAGVSLLSLLSSAVKEKTGVDFASVFKTIREGIENGDEEFKDSHDYDVFFGFNQVMQRLKDELQKLTKDRTVVFVIDELDRCLPEYAIKVLERLHHLTEESQNIISIISVDKEKLARSIDHYFGFEQSKKYLEKFIRFEVKLDCGTVTESVSEKYKDYYALFDKDLFQFNDSVEEFIQAIFKNVDMRTQEQLVERAMLTHKLLFNDKKDYTFMCMELLLAVMICVYDNDLEIPVDIDPPNLDNVFVQHGKGAAPAFYDFFVEKSKDFRWHEKRGYTDNSMHYIIIGEPNMYSTILSFWCRLHKQNRASSIVISRSSLSVDTEKNYEDLKTFAEMIKLIS